MMSSAKLSRKIFGPKKMTKELKKLFSFGMAKTRKRLRWGKRLSAAKIRQADFGDGSEFD